MAPAKKVKVSSALVPAPASISDASSMSSSQKGGISKAAKASKPAVSEAKSAPRKPNVDAADSEDEKHVEQMDQPAVTPKKRGRKPGSKNTNKKVKSDNDALEWELLSLPAALMMGIKLHVLVCLL